ncbi:M13 family metallopeptidase [Oenococcus sp. UCMA 16435]|nr:M13 family metallopeptidase [Oenococcus sp. UCMA 16435]
MIPAAILTFPFFSLNGSRFSNYSSIGTIILHEMSHALDLNSSQFDGRGNLSSWSNHNDTIVYEHMVQRLIQQICLINKGFEDVHGHAEINEIFTDTTGLQIAASAAKLTSTHTARQFFFAWAKI